MLREIEAKVGPRCHYCSHPELYPDTPPGFPCACTPAPLRNGASVVNHRSAAGYPSRSEVDRSPVEIRDSGGFGRILRVPLMGRRVRSSAVISRSAVIFRSSGDAALGLTRDPRRPDRMAAVLTCTDDQGRFVRVALSPIEVRNLHHDAQELLDADAEQVSRWWYELNRVVPGRRRRRVGHPRYPARRRRHASVEHSGRERGLVVNDRRIDLLIAWPDNQIHADRKDITTADGIEMLRAIVDEDAPDRYIELLIECHGSLAVLEDLSTAEGIAILSVLADADERGEDTRDVLALLGRRCECNHDTTAT